MAKECDKCKDSTSTRPEGTIEETSEVNQLQENASFETNSLDHGKPPVEIEALVKKILSLPENIE